jgi:signal transduction histidine kinase
MKRIFAAILVNLLLVSFSFAAGGTANEAKALIVKGVAFVKAEGKEKAFAEFTNPKGKFVDRDLYIFAVDFNGITLAHGGNAKLVGKDLIGLKDADGIYFMKKFIEMAKTQGSGWVEYKWVNPVTKKIESKSTYIQKMDNYFLGCGIYK